VTVVLDTNMTEALLEEGFVRELVSKLQTMRKEAGFEVMDHIAIGFAADAKVTGIFEKYADAIQKEVLGVSITNGSLSGYEKDWNINGEAVKLSVEKKGSDSE
jgi:isoleucyl-tRNA synthetase